MTSSAVISPQLDDLASAPSVLSRYRDWAASAAYYLLLGSLFVTTLAFGGAHRSTSLWATLSISLAFVLAVISSFRCAATIARSWGLNCARASLLWLLAWSLIQPWITGPLVNQHPILGHAVWFRDFDTYQMALRCIALASITCECTILLASQRFKLARICTALIILGALVAVIALVHWLYDNGKLFFIFSPEHSAIQQRARWPFVNPNHLATFLLIPLALSSASIAYYWSELLHFYQNRRRRRIELLVSDQRAQKYIFRWGLSLLATIFIGVALLATFSRANWIAAALMFMALMLAPPLRPAIKDKPKLEIVTKKNRSQRAGWNFDWLRIHIHTLGRIGFFALIAAVILLLLNDQGVDLIQNRLEYSLLASKDDMRWQLYRDSWQLFRQNMFFGIGLGAWPSAFAEILNPRLSGINPGYLHSDPMQLLLEIGLVGFLPLALGLLACGCFVLKSVWRARKNEAALARALILGIFATLFASLADFPFRMLSIQIQTVVCLVLALLSATQIVQPVSTHREEPLTS